MVISTFKSLLLSAVVLFAGSGMNNCMASTVATTVYFGDHTQEPCVGRGVCYHNPPSASEAAGGILVNFTTMASDPNIVVMSFSLSALRASQPEQIEYFTSESHTYSFDSDFSLTDEAFSALGLQNNAMIATTSPTYVEISGDVVTVYITYSHD